MSLDLREGVSTKSGLSGGNVSIYGREVSGGEVRQTLGETVDELRRVLATEELAGDKTFQDFMRYLKSMYPKDYGDRWDRWPHGRVLTTVLGWPVPAGYVGPTVELMGIQLTGFEVAHFTDYVMTNTSLEDLDPRERYLDELRGDIQGQPTA